ncbi:hypothetical protein MD484_g2207, partial [Candolleomyces efflorescens]
MVTRTSVAMQMEYLIYGPFKAAAMERGSMVAPCPFLIVIDGLDECENKEEVQELIESMITFFEEHPLIPLRVFITSRVEQHIQSHLDVPGVRLENLVDHCSNHDIDTFLSVLFEDAGRRDRVIRAYVRQHGEWPSQEDKQKLVSHIGGSFIFASSVSKFILGSSDGQDQAATPMDRLPLALNMNPGLDGLYAQTLTRSEHLPHFLNIVSTIALLEEPLPASGIAELLGINIYEVVNVLVNLQAIIQVPGTDDIPVTLCHTSLRDFFTTEGRSGRFFAQPSHHVVLQLRCFQCELEARRRRSIPESSNDTRWDVSPAVAYALRYWEHHSYSGTYFRRQAHLDHAIELRREALQLPPCISTPVVYDAPLISCLKDRYMHNDSLADLEEALAISWEALTLSRYRWSLEAHVHLLLFSIAHSLRFRYWHLGYLTDLEKAIFLNRAALGVPSSSQKPRRIFDNLGRLLLDRYRHTGDRADLAKVVSGPSASVGNCTQDRTYSADVLGTGLLYQFLCTGVWTDLETSISLLRDSIAQLPFHDANRYTSLDALAKGLRERYQHTKDLDDLEEAIVWLREALKLRPSPHPDRQYGLSLLGSAILDHYRCTKNAADLEEASGMLREAIRLHPLLYPERSTTLNGSGNALLDQYRCTGTVDNLEEAILCFREALKLRPSAHPDHSLYLHGLGDALLERYRHSGAVKDLEETIVSYRKTVDLCPSHSQESSTGRASLATSLQLLYERTRSLSTLQEAIVLRAELLAFHYLEGHQDRVECLGDLANFFQMRFDVTGEEEDLAQIAELRDEASQLSPPTPSA